jgi:CRP/FNR family cyclic AMP-dependent transcriptional regulator
VRHVMFSLAAFAAFIVFYSFAGQPSLRKLTFLPAPHLVNLIVVTTATLFLVRRLRRTPTIFAEETLARSILKHWKWADMRPPQDLREAFLVHNIKSRESDREALKALEVYSDAVREVIANGFVAREEVKLLEHLRGRLQIKKSDHEKVMALLAKEERALLSNASGHIFVEKRLQLETYARALAKFIERVIAAQGDPDDTFIVRLRSEYAVTEAEHMAVLDELLGGASALAGRLGEELRTIERSASTIKALELSPSATHDLLVSLLRRRRAEAVESLLRALNFAADENGVETLRNALCSSDEALRQTGVRQLRASLPPAVAERLMSAYGEAGVVEAPPPSLVEVLEARLRSVDPYVRAVALLALSERGAATAPVLETMNNDEHELVRDTAAHLLKSIDAEGTSVRAGLCRVEKMIALRSVPLFAHLRPEELSGLARASHEAEFRPGADLCVEGESGNEVFILIAGDVEVVAKSAEGERLVGREQAGGFIGELAVLDPAPRSAQVRAGESGAHVLRLDGDAFRHAVDEESSIATHVIRVLARRLRRTSKR